VSEFKNERGSWGSRIGFLLAAAGSAIGLGNVWKFPYLCGEYGGAAFIVTYIIILVLVGFTIMITELMIGRHSQKGPVGAYRAIKERWAWVGAIGILASYLILTYYSVIGGWIIKYIVSGITGNFNTTDVDALGGIFATFIGQPFEPLVYHAIFMILTLVIVMGGIQGGIEKASKIMMPALFVILFIVVIRAVTLPGASIGLEYMLKPDWSKFGLDVVVAALVQVFFSLSLGMGVIITYGSYLGKDEKLTTSAVQIPLMDSAAALLSAFAVLPAVFALGYNPSAGPGLLFITLPGVFAKMPMGSLFGVLFFIFVLFAALTSSISLLEAAVTYFVDEHKWQRKKAVIILGLVAFLIGVPSSLANGAFGDVTFINGMNFFDSMSFFAENILLPLSAFLLSIFVAWVWGTENAIKEATNNGTVNFGFSKVWIISIKYIAPIGIGFILLQSIMSLF
jgi:NSS family neurotransmitter:Na+ symporter